MPSPSRSPFKVLLVTGGDTPAVRLSAKRLTELLEASPRFNVSAVTLTSNGAPALGTLPGSDFDAVALLVDHDGALPAKQVKGLLDFVRKGGGLVALHSTARSFRDNRELIELIGAQVEPTGETPFEFHVNFTPQARAAGHTVAARVDDFVICDRFLRIEAPQGAQVFATGHLSGRPTPLGYSIARGDGQVVYLGLGGTAEAFDNPHLQRMIERALRHVANETFDTTVRAGILGYGGAFNMGLKHAQSINAQLGMSTVAVCDLDPARTAQAQQELGEEIRTYNDMDAFMADDAVDLVVVILPHNLHAKACIAAAKAGKHAVTEKPFCITLAEADEMIAAANEAGTMLSCFHNRRWDGDFQQILTLVRSGQIGEVFHVDAATGGWSVPRAWWRASKEISGGVLYDWGAHYVDWMLNIMNRRIASVSGVLQKRRWHNVSNEDYALVNLRFEDGTSATLEQGMLVAVPRQGWRILGTTGGLSNGGPGGDVTLIQLDGQVRREAKLAPWQSKWANYFQNVANHLIMGERLIVTAEQARRVIGVFDLAEKSNQQGGQPLPLPGEDQFACDYVFPW